MKKSRFIKIFAACRENVAKSENAIIELQRLFVDGNICAAAARRRFLVLWAAFVVDVQRYNKIFNAWEDYDEKHFKECHGSCNYISVPWCVSKYYNWFMK